MRSKWSLRGFEPRFFHFWRKNMILMKKKQWKKQDLNPRSSGLKLSAKPTELSSLVTDYSNILSYWGNTVVLGRMYRWMRSSFRRIGGQYLLRGEAPKKGIAPQFWGMMTAFTDISDPELLYSHCWQVKTRIFNLVKNHVLGFLGGL